LVTPRRVSRDGSPAFTSLLRPTRRPGRSGTGTSRTVARLAGRGGWNNLQRRPRRRDTCRPCRHHRVSSGRAHRRDARDNPRRAHRRCRGRSFERSSPSAHHSEGTGDAGAERRAISEGDARRGDGTSAETPATSRVARHYTGVDLIAVQARPPSPAPPGRAEAVGSLQRTGRRACGGLGVRGLSRLSDCAHLNTCRGDVGVAFVVLRPVAPGLADVEA
jgi:hypothetical protein